MNETDNKLPGKNLMIRELPASARTMSTKAVQAFLLVAGALIFGLALLQVYLRGGIT
jgi:hypothetical protein